MPVPGLGTGTLAQAPLGPACPRGVGGQHRGVDQRCLWGILLRILQSSTLLASNRAGKDAGESTGSAVGGFSLNGEAFPCF